MTLLIGVVLSLGILLWRMDSSLEWHVPAKWQRIIRNWQSGLSKKTHTLHYVWNVGSENSELERDFWRLQLALSTMQKKFKVPLWIKVCLDQSMVIAQRDIYISCLQRRFPELEIYGVPISGDSKGRER